jgi:hypothetical protein
MERRFSDVLARYAASTADERRRKGRYEVAVTVSENSDLDEAARDVLELRDHGRWVALENVLPLACRRDQMVPRTATAPMTANATTATHASVLM